ncbi:site-specific DNA-methyltransferase [Mycobacteroides abscessus]|uniref:site-specific DNA-methyltransferase n=1 Tax=Mycobacteroides abscessus TaxID=36809 RepID=UPI000E67E85E|nr:site-specific DNA-methyltransferase [Mycobacteroides abscessus]RIU41042.1 site-specific DNA-methyltransferase [Mycobacteroides abscessus]
MADETNILDQLISRVGDESLRSHLAREVDLLRGSRHFGLVFDRHLPESVRLVDYPIRKGVRVALRDESSTDTWTVVGFADQERKVAVLGGDGGERPVDDLVVVREFGEPVYPGLRSVERIANGPEDAPWHLVINGENYHALQALRSTHREKIDLIYIDPPYNTGNDGWIYNDRYVDQNDRAKSSKWLSFLERRLVIAKDLLKPTGIIIAAIGDGEHHRLRMLLDQVFGDLNFISDVVWQGGRKNDSRYVSNGADYMLIYAKDETVLSSREVRWREPRKAHGEMLAAGQTCWEESGHSPELATRLMKEWIRGLPRDHPARENNRFYEFDPDTGRVFRKDNVSWPGGGGPRYDVLHPVTGKPVRVPGSGWRYSSPERMQEMIDAGRILFGPDHTHYVNRKLYLDDAEMVVADSVFNQKRTSASTRLQAIFGDKRFPNPKDHEVLMRWFRMAAPQDAVILDFFAGSGTTTDAVMRLNAEDGGSRQSIIVTNNELSATEAKKLRKAGLHPGDAEWESKGIFEYVCRPRISTVVTGKRPDGSEYSDGLPANVEMFDLVYLDPSAVRRGIEFPKLAPLFWLHGGARRERIEGDPGEGWALTATYGVLFEIDTLVAFADAVTAAATTGEPPSVLFIVTDSLAEYQQAVERLPVGIDTVQLYEDYLLNYADNFAGGVR